MLVVTTNEQRRERRVSHRVGICPHCILAGHSLEAFEPSNALRVGGGWGTGQFCPFGG